MITGTDDFKDRISFEFAYFNAPRIDTSHIEVGVRNLMVDGQILEHCTIVFNHARKSARRMYHYISGATEQEGFQGFEPKIILEDVLFAEGDGVFHPYKLEGVYLSPEGQKSWLGWDIEAQNYLIQEE